MNNVAPIAQPNWWTVILRRPDRFAARLMRIALLCLLATIVLASAFGYLTYQLTGQSGLWAMLLAVFISMFSNIAGSIPACLRAGSPTAQNGLSIMAVGMVLRLVILVVMAAPLVFGKIVAVQPFLIWLAGAYNVHLLIESAVMMSWLNQSESHS